MIGANSKTKLFIVPCDGVNIEVNVQMDKNNAVCDIVLPMSMKAPKKPFDTSKGGLVKKYNEEKKVYDQYMKERAELRSLLMNVFKGRQIEICKYSLNNVLYNIFNA